jgi:hypothetical protein
MSEMSASRPVERGRSGDPLLAHDLQIAIIDAAARIVAGPQSSQLIQDPDIAQGVAASFRTVYDAILEAVSGPPAPPPLSRADAATGK